MKKSLVLLLLLSLAPVLLFASDKDLGGIKLLEGYSAEKESAVDATAWMIEKKGGPAIYFEAGFSEGSWANPKDGETYAWYREQMVNGYKVRFALIKPGVRTHWDNKDGRKLQPGNILLVTFLLEGEKSYHTANFSAKVAEVGELADVLLMVMTFDPSKGTF